MKVILALFALFFSQSGGAMELSDYKGKVVLVVNIATRCGYTGQLAGLESLHQKYKEKGLVVVGVPSNDFGSQTPEGDEEVKKFCKLNYGVSFPVTAKMVVKGENKNKLFKELTKTESGEKEIAWNFEKFLIDRSGQLVQRFSSRTAPDDKQLASAIESALGSRKP